MSPLNTHATLEEFSDFITFNKGNRFSNLIGEKPHYFQSFLDTAKIDIDPTKFGDRTKLAHLYKSMFLCWPDQENYLKAFRVLQKGMENEKREEFNDNW